MPKLFSNQDLPKTDEEALREFNDRYLLAVSTVQPDAWGQDFVIPMQSMRMTFPLSTMTAVYRETVEHTSRFKTLENKSFDLKVSEFDCGWEESWLKLSQESFTYQQWLRGGDEMAKAEDNFVNRGLAALLENGTVGLSPWDDLPFFSASHLIDPFNGTAGTFSNFEAAATDVTTIAGITSQVTAMRNVLDPGGNKMGLEPDTLWVPTSKFQATVNVLSQAMINNGESNPFLGKFNIRHIKELIDSNDWYIADSRAAVGLLPMMAGKFVPDSSLAYRVWDTSSEFFKKTSRIKVSSHIYYGFVYGMPHAIRRVTGV